MANKLHCDICDKVLTFARNDGLVGGFSVAIQNRCIDICNGCAEKTTAKQIHDRLTSPIVNPRAVNG